MGDTLLEAATIAFASGFIVGLLVAYWKLWRG